MNLPFIKFFPRDWIGDIQLRMVSPAARGFWMDCLCVMHMARRFGYLETQDGMPLTDEQLSNVTATPIDSKKTDCVANLKKELINAGIPSIEESSGIWYSRRMVKDAIKRAKCSKAGKDGGGNPKLKKELNVIEDNNTRVQNPDATFHISLKDTLKGGVERRSFTFEQIKSMCAGVGLKEEDLQNYYNNYESVGWIDANGLKITNIAAKAAKWKSTESSKGKSTNKPAWQAEADAIRERMLKS